MRPFRADLMLEGCRAPKEIQNSDIFRPCVHIYPEQYLYSSYGFSQNMSLYTCVQVLIIIPILFISTLNISGTIIAVISITLPGLGVGIALARAIEVAGTASQDCSPKHLPKHENLET